MSRKRIGPEVRPAGWRKELAERLTAEIKNGRDHGQPFIFEQEYPTGKIRVVVVWDAWRRVPFGERTATILRAYELAEGKEYRDRLALVSGLTVPEAHATGMLPYQMITARRNSDPISFEEARQALVDEGASALADPEALDLRFATEEDALAAKQRLVRRFPGTEDVWLINREVEAHDDFQLHDGAEAVEE